MLAACVTWCGGSEVDPQLSCYNVVWRSPSSDLSGSMPLGNGDIGVNVWCESNGDLLFYISKTDAWSENGRLLKLGRVRLTADPPLYAAGDTFRQELDLSSGTILVSISNAQNQTSNVKLWVDANHPAICLDAESDTAREWRISVEMWRTVPRTITDATEKQSAYGIMSGPDPIVVEPDTVVTGLNDRVIWYHRNERSIWEDTLTVQSLSHLTNSMTDPLLDRTFGATLYGVGLTNSTAATLVSTGAMTTLSATIIPLTALSESATAWRDELDMSVLKVESLPRHTRCEAHTTWWEAFWNRHWIMASGSRNLSEMILPTMSPLRIGADPDGNNRFFGKMSRVGIYSGPLSPAEVITLAATDRHTVPGTDDRRVAAWRFDTLANGTIPDLANGLFPLSVAGTLALVDDGGVNVLSFGGGGYLSVDHNDALTLTNGFTLEAWIAPDVLPGSGARIIDKGVVGTSQGYVCDSYPGNDLRSIINSGTLMHDANMPTGTWAHVAVTADPATRVHRIYLNGAVVQEDALSLDGFVVSQGYILQRFINACGGRGNSPIKFNGSLFTVDMSGYDADFRKWGPCYWWQNTRLPYWTMLMAGDFDLMQPLFDMYMNALPLARERVMTYYGHEGAYFPETMYFWGTWNNDNYGWYRTGKEVGRSDNDYIRWEWQGGIELTAMMLDYYDLTDDDTFVTNTLAPFADEIIKLYDLRYSRESDGTIRFTPAQALETYWEGTENPMPEVAGLHHILPRLLELPEYLVTAVQTSRWTRLHGELPDLPLRDVSGQTVLAPAEVLGSKHNVEHPELYAVFPYRQYRVGKPNLELARATYDVRVDRNNSGWEQGPIFAARLGLSNDAADQLVSRFGTKHTGSRFPAMWGPNYDWIPDQDHGGVCMIALQQMLMQCDGDRILLFPAWPADWNVTFRLHAPGQTIVEGELANGVITRFHITPANRYNDVETYIGELPMLPRTSSLIVQ